jgi:3-deoxy-7-phosphoheptulonate synthase
MIVVMKSEATKPQIEHVVNLVREMGLKDHVIVGTERTVVAVIGNDRFKDRSVLESVEGVEKVVPILAPYKMASKEIKKERSVVPFFISPRTKGAPAGASPSVGGKKIGVIAGPCSVENKTQLLEIAHAVKEAGATGLRGGAFKPRTNPYSFQGLAEEGLKLLALAREETGLAVVTEVMAVEQVKLVADYADVLQVGARNMQNFNLLNAVGEQSKPVLLKRGMSATLEEFLLAAEYIMAKGNSNVMLCERGIRTYEEYVRNTLALAAVPELQRVSHLPVIVDPSQGTGKNHLVDSMCRAAVAAGADGLIIEVHNDPAHALTDGAQSITPQQFSAMMTAIKRIALAVDREV